MGDHHPVRIGGVEPDIVVVTSRTVASFNGLPAVLRYAELDTCEIQLIRISGGYCHARVVWSAFRDIMIARLQGPCLPEIFRSVQGRTLDLKECVNNIRVGRRNGYGGFSHGMFCTARQSLLRKRFPALPGVR